ncbi:MAG: hypothetical protein IPN89_16330 [Saprospiraceae bacterium]|nr:hypothetical protein [Saprospiraceae bacterium]
MLNFTLPTSLKIQWLSIFIVLLLNYNSAAGQCNLNISNTTNPSSCNASNGSFVISAFNGACPRKISVYKNNVIINQGYGNLSVTGQTSGNFDVVADPDCGCPSPSSQVVTLFSGTPTTLTPYVNTGSGSYQANKVYICRGSNVSLGVQALGLSSLSMTGPAGYSDNTPDGSSYWNLTNLQPSQSGVYTISYTNADGCISNVNFTVTVGSLSINAGSDKSACIGTTHTISPIVSGQSVCTPSCPATLDSLLVKWTLDQCNASNQTNQIDYSEFLPVYPSKGNCVAVTATNMYRKTGEHSCTPVLGSYTGDIGVCVPAMDSCDPLLYNPDQAVKVEVTITPQEAGRITKLSFREQSPLVWITTNGASGPNNYNTKYLLKVYKNNLLIYSEDNRLTERSWNLETIDFSANPAFAVTETSTFRFELRGYCVTNTGGNMSGWELDDIRVYGGCCKNLQSSNAVSYLWSTGETTSSISVTPSSSTNYMVTVTDCNGCKQTDDVNITVYPLPAAEISGNLSICAGGSTVLTASGGTGYVWSTGATTSSITLTPVTSINVAVTVTSANGCQKSKAVTVVVNPLPSPLISGDLDICFGQSTTLTASGGTSFEWSSGATTPSITVNPSANTIYRLMATDVNGCRDYTEAQVIVHPLPVVSITGDIEICFGENTSLTASGGSVYVWNTGSTTADINVSPVSNALYTVTVTDINGCSAIKNIQVIVNPLPVVVIGGNSLFCTGTSSLLTASGASTYLWNTGATTTSIMVNPGLTSTYTVTATDTKGCTSSASRMLTVNALPQAMITGDKKICEGSSATLIASGGVLYNWESGQNTSSITVLPASTTIYRVTVTDVNGCTGTSAQAVIVNPKPTVSITGVSEFCMGNSTKLTANVSGTTFCEKDCKDEQLLIWNFNACDASDLPNQLNYGEFTPSLISTGGLLNITGTNASRILGDHSCTPDGNGGVGMCFGAMKSCDPNDYNPQNGLRFTVSVTPNEIGQLTKLTFREQAPLNWVTTNGATGINNYNEKYLIRVFKNGILVYSKNDLLTERTWNTESIDFTNNPEFRITSNATFTFELYGYCTIERGGTAGWEVDDLKIFGGECKSSPSVNNISYIWSNGATSSMIEVSPTATSTYSVTVTDCNGCLASDSKAVTVNPLPTPAITGNIVICNGESTTLTASGGTTYVWSNGSTTSVITVSPASTTTYNVTVTDANGCQASTSVTVTVNPLPTPAITGNTVICNGASTTLTASGGTTYVWSNGATTSAITVSPASTTTYNVTVSDANGCQASTSVTVTVNPLPTPAITGNTVICNGASTTLTASGGTTYVWSNGATTSAITVSPTSTTTYNVTVTDANGCQASTNVTVTVNPLPTPAITGNIVICNGASTTLTASGGTTYVWSNGATTSVITVSPASTTTYYVTVTDANGCQASTSVTVTVNPLPTPSITGNTVICNGASTTLTASGGTTYVWSNGSTTSAITISPTSTTTYNVTVSDANGCQASTSVTVTVNPLPTPAITGNTVICNGASTTLTASGGTTYVWSNGATTSAITVSPTSTTTYNVTVTDANGCQASTSVTVTVNPLPTPAITGNIVICNGASTTLTTSGGTTYVWSNGATTSAITVSPASTTTYNVTVTDANGCQASTSVTVTVNPLPTPAITGNIVICNGESTTLTASGGTTYVWSNGATTSVITVSPASTTTYNVTVSDANGCQASTSVTVAVNPLPTPAITGNTVICNGESTTLTASGGTTYVWSNGATTSAITVSPTSTTTYNVTVSDANGCQASTSVTVTVNPLPTPAITGNTVICNGESTTLTASGGTTYVWSNGSTTSAITVSPASTTTYNVTVTDANGCQASTSVTVTVNPLPTPAITGNTVICNGESTTLTASGGTTYVWSNGSTTSVITVSPASTTTYNVTVTDANGCQASTSVAVTVNPLPTPAITGNTVICNGESTTLTASGGTTYVWSNGSTTSAITVSPTSTTTYNVTVTDANGCQASASVTVTVNPLPTQAITGDIVICNGANTTLRGSGGTTYVWSNGSTTSVITVSPQSTTTYNVTVTDANGCQASTSVAVTVKPLPTPSITGNTVICNGASTTLTASGGTTYVWSNGSTTSVITVSPTSTTTYNVTVTDANGCQASTSVTVTVNPLPTPAITGNTVICNGASTTLTASGGTTYVWSNGATTSAITISPTSTTTYNVTVTDANGCQASASVTVTVNPLPTPAITGNTVICNGESTTLTASGGTTYVWSNGATTSAITVSPASSTTYDVTVTDANGCQASTSVTVAVNPLPTPAITGNTVICNGASTTLTASGGTTYVWSNGATTSAITVSPASTTTYNVTVTDANGCQASTSVTVTVNPLPTPAITGNIVICNGASTTLTASGGTTLCMEQRRYHICHHRITDKYDHL